MPKKDLRVWNGNKCTCEEKKEGRCQPAGSYIVKVRSSCIFFKTEKAAKDYIGEIHHENNQQNEI